MSGIKICGLFRECDIDFVNEAKPDYIGFVLHFPKSHRNISPGKASELRKRLEPGILAAGVFVNQSIDTVLRTADRIGLDVIQLHGEEDDNYIQELKPRAFRPVWKAFKVRTEADLLAAENSFADEILLDNGYGTGKVFDWSAAAGLSRPFILAGGLTPGNIPEAVRLLGPKMVDISSGVETDRVKDKEKIIAAVRAARKASGLYR